MSPTAGPEVALGDLDLRLREPAGEPAGALILNHGRATDENDLFGLVEALDPERRLLGITTGAPLRGLPPGGRHWYVVQRVGYPHPETFHRSYELLGNRLDALLAERGIEWSRVAIGGFSQGTVMSYALALGPGRPTPGALLALSGFVPTVDGWEPDLVGRGGLRVLIHHGAADPVIGVELGRAARDLLEGGGLAVRYLETDAGHWLPPEILPALRETIAPSGRRGRGGRLRPTATDLRRTWDIYISRMCLTRLRNAPPRGAECTLVGSCALVGS